MRQYIARRLLLTVPVVWGVSLIVFIAINLVPGDVVLAQLQEKIQPTQEELQKMRAELGLDRPLHVQYLSWLGGVLRGDLGDSLLTREPVTKTLKTAIPSSMELAFLTAVVAFAIAIPLGVLSAVRQDTWMDYVARLFSIGGLAVPSFVIATLVILLPTIWWGWMPPLETASLWEDPVRNLQQYFPAALALGLHFSATTMRMTRSSMLEVLREDYIRTAHAKGLRHRAVIYRHALRNALVPVVTVMGHLTGYLLGGLVIAEAIFGLPGLGSVILRAIDFADYTMLGGAVLVIAVIYVLMNLTVDIAYSWIDPRIRYS